MSAARESLIEFDFDPSETAACNTPEGYCPTCTKDLDPDGWCFECRTYPDGEKC